MGDSFRFVLSWNVKGQKQIGHGCFPDSWEFLRAGCVRVPRCYSGGGAGMAGMLRSDVLGGTEAMVVFDYPC